jgi:hypothetical protein
MIDEIETSSPKRSLQPPLELWIVEANSAYEWGNPEHAITYGELKARPTRRTSYPTRIEVRLVHADMGRPATCCQPGGECYALHGPVTENDAYA